MTTQQKIIKYLQGRKTPATQAEIARGAKVNPNTLRRELAMPGWANVYATDFGQIEREIRSNRWVYRVA